MKRKTDEPSSGVSRDSLSSFDLAKMYNSMIKLSASKNIFCKNAFDMKLIDVVDVLIKRKAESFIASLAATDADVDEQQRLFDPNKSRQYVASQKVVQSQEMQSKCFEEVRLALGVSGRIYAHRVDSLFSDVQHMYSSLKNQDVSEEQTELNEQSLNSDAIADLSCFTGAAPIIDDEHDIVSDVVEGNHESSEDDESDSDRLLKLARIMHDHVNQTFSSMDFGKHQQVSSTDLVDCVAEEAHESAADLPNVGSMCRQKALDFEVDPLTMAIFSENDGQFESSNLWTKQSLCQSLKELVNKPVLPDRQQLKAWKPTFTFGELKAKLCYSIDAFNQTLNDKNANSSATNAGDKKQPGSCKCPQDTALIGTMDQSKLESSLLENSTTNAMIDGRCSALGMTSIMSALNDTAHISAISSVMNATETQATLAIITKQKADRPRNRKKPKQKISKEPHPIDFNDQDNSYLEVFKIKTSRISTRELKTDCWANSAFDVHSNADITEWTQMFSEIQIDKNASADDGFPLDVTSSPASPQISFESGQSLIAGHFDDGWVGDTLNCQRNHEEDEDLFVDDPYEVVGTIPQDNMNKENVSEVSDAIENGVDDANDVSKNVDPPAETLQKIKELADMKPLVYNRQSKHVNMKVLKRRINRWICDREGKQGSMMLTALVNDLYSNLTVQQRYLVSLPLIMLSLLTLANENDWSLKSSPQMNDVEISQDKPTNTEI